MPKDSVFLDKEGFLIELVDGTAMTFFRSFAAFLVMVLCADFVVDFWVDLVIDLAFAALDVIGARAMFGNLLVLCHCLGSRSVCSVKARDIWPI